MKLKLFIRYWFPVIVWLILIFTLSSLPQQIVTERTAQFYIPDWISHIFEFSVLSFLLFRAFDNSNKIKLRNLAITLAIIITIFYGIFDEIHQYFVPGRVFSIFDILADSIGAFLILTKKFFKGIKTLKQR